MRTLILVTALSAAQQTADQLPEHLRCEIMGVAGCANDICVGSGSYYQGISMTIQTAERKVALNGIEGRVSGPEPLEYGQRRSLSWNPRLIGLSEIHVRPERNFRDKSGTPFTVVELTSDRDLVEFKCKPDGSALARLTSAFHPFRS